jgi:Cu/Ag efflux pump CusA
METTENNKLIAEFMGDGKEYEVDINTKTLKSYNTSWDWLMPVIDKCYQEHMGKHIEEAVMTCDIRKAYQLVIEYLKEYNKQN